MAPAKMAHREIAALVSTKYKVGGWWTQTVTVGYERIKGLRARGQRRDGTYEASKSRTFNVPVADLFDAWADARRAQAMARCERSGECGRPRAEKSMRLDWPGPQDHRVGFMPKGSSKSAVAIQHTKLREQETADELKQNWSERLDALRGCPDALVVGLGSRHWGRDRGQDTGQTLGLTSRYGLTRPDPAGAIDPSAMAARRAPDGPAEISTMAPISRTNFADPIVPACIPRVRSDPPRSLRTAPRC